MNASSDGDLAVALTGLCTFLVQGPPFDAGDEVEVIFVRELADGRSTTTWLPVNATLPDASRDTLCDDERCLASQVVLIRATLDRTGGFPRDSMNRPRDSYDPDALTLSDVRVIDRHPPANESTAPDGLGDNR